MCVYVSSAELRPHGPSCPGVGGPLSFLNLTRYCVACYDRRRQPFSETCVPSSRPLKNCFFSTRYLFIHKHQLLLFSIFKAPNPRVPGAVAPRAPWLIRHCTWGTPTSQTKPVASGVSDSCFKARPNTHTCTVRLFHGSVAGRGLVGSPAGPGPCLARVYTLPAEVFDNVRFFLDYTSCTSAS